MRILSLSCHALLGWVAEAQEVGQQEEEHQGPERTQEGGIGLLDLLQRCALFFAFNNLFVLLAFFLFFSVRRALVCSWS
jgi:hypothetical protein